MPWRCLTLGCFLVAGCGKSGSDAPAAAKSAEFDVPVVAKAIMTALDKDGNGCIDEREAAASPALAVAFAAFDTDNSKTLSIAELMARLDLYKAKGASSLPVSVYVTHNGISIESAKVTLEPESFFSTVLSTATSVTEADGRASVWQVGSEKLTGLSAGLYRVKVEKEGFPSVIAGAEVFSSGREAEAGIYIKLNS